MEEIFLDLGHTRYGVFVGERVYEEKLPELLEGLSWNRLVVVSHPGIMSLQGHRLVNALSSVMGERELVRFLFPEGEENKSFSTLLDAYRFLLSREVNREDVLLAFGGGVVGDLAGFLAATYQRGMEYLQIPTTLMAMVDSSIGGKVGVDLPEAKNAVGAFYHPRAVVADTEVLVTLPPEEIRNGMVEVAKYGFLFDSGLLHAVRKWGKGGTVISPDLRREIVYRCVRHKVRVVKEDEKDRSGRRALLNYGHTFGHALEAATGYKVLRHGEAVGLGMLMAARLSEELGIADRGLYREHAAVLLPLLEGVAVAGGVSVEKVLSLMRSDKKRRRETRFVLLEAPQKPHLVESVPEEKVKEAVVEVLEEWVVRRT
jgi:3-dehydroquinate synthase